MEILKKPPPYSLNWTVRLTRWGWAVLTCGSKWARAKFRYLAAQKLIQNVKITPVVDGGLKNTLERSAAQASVTDPWPRIGQFGRAMLTMAGHIRFF